MKLSRLLYLDIHKNLKHFRQNSGQNVEYVMRHIYEYEYFLKSILLWDTNNFYEASLKYLF